MAAKTNHKTIGDEIRLAREATGFTQAEMARILAIPRQVLNGWERGRRKPRPRRLGQLMAEMRAVNQRAEQFSRYLSASGQPGKKNKRPVH